MTVIAPDSGVRAGTDDVFISGRGSTAPNLVDIERRSGMTTSDASQVLKEVWTGPVMQQHRYAVGYAEEPSEDYAMPKKASSRGMAAELARLHTPPRPAETTAGGLTLSALIAFALGLEPTDEIVVTAVTVIGFTPAIVTYVSARGGLVPLVKGFVRRFLGV